MEVQRAELTFAHQATNLNLLFKISDFPFQTFRDPAVGDLVTFTDQVPMDIAKAIIFYRTGLLIEEGGYCLQ